MYLFDDYIYILEYMLNLLSFIQILGKSRSIIHDAVLHLTGRG